MTRRRLRRLDPVDPVDIDDVLGLQIDDIPDENADVDPVLDEPTNHDDGGNIGGGGGSVHHA